MSEKKAKEERAKQGMSRKPQQTFPVEEALQMQNERVGMLLLQIDIMTRQMNALENENQQLKEKIKK